FDFTFTKKIFFTTFLQYNNQIDNFNINARFQWRFAPVSDLFIVYTNNFDTTANWQYTNRALVLKVNYWLNL
ncbi:MAG TPA: hydrolase, partial [Saprospiraceae bacterium]|nr:hydrolase [Saprospiraceae bacterium]